MRVEEERMKESGMDKLIELSCLIEPLEKYLLELAKRNPLYTKLNVNLPGVSILGIHETILISKKFGFIKWLYENDKIDFRKLDDNPDWYDINTNREYFDLIALISIQDNPIEFLISILR